LNAETRYQPNADQLALANEIEGSLDSVLPLARVHRSYVEDAATWSSLEEIGVFGISRSEAEGGSGLGAVEETLIVTALGRRLVAPAILATIGAAQAPLDEHAARLRGQRVAAGYRHDQRILIVADDATKFALVRNTADAELHEWHAAASRPVDDRLWLGALRETSALGETLARFEAAQLLRLRLLDAAALAGIAQAALDMGVAYAGIRQQFGRPIGSFQAVKHHCANMAIAARCARDQATFAAVALDEKRDDAALQIECALYVAGSAALENAGKNIQIHGGIGFSDEADPHLFLKRAQLQIAIAGGLEACNWRIANIKGSD
jgi:alkylation response protein AidB-like acyl-CoA dehydrogenase